MTQMRLDIVSKYVEQEILARGLTLHLMRAPRILDCNIYIAPVTLKHLTANVNRYPLNKKLKEII